MRTKFFLCTVCGNVAVKVMDSGADLSCCGQEMNELVPQKVDGLGEKHLPVVKALDDGKFKVEVSTVAHPMTREHRIEFIYLETEHGGHIHYLKAGEPAEAIFRLCKDKPVAAYAYCNIHGLWKTQL